MFRSAYQMGYAKVVPMNMSSIKEVLRRLVLKAGLRANHVKIGKRYNKQLEHGFRKRFNTIMKTTPNMNISLAEKMMGHSVTVALDNVYLDPTIEQLFTEFKKAIPELIIDGEVRKQAQLDIMTKENQILEKTNKDNALRLEKVESWVAEQSKK